jgi:AcrR family transcriptional regulator
MENRTALEVVGTGERSTEDETTRRRPRLSLERLVAAAMEVAREIGADRLTMKDVAGRLGVGTMSLYYYVPDKAALLDELVARLYGEVVLPDRCAPWPEQVDLIARQLYGGFCGVPGLDPMAALRQPPHAHVSRVMNATLAALHDAGLSPHDAAVASMVVLGFAVGRGTAATRPVRATTAARLDTGRLAPETELVHPASDQVFDFGLKVLIDGLAQRVAPSIP